ncbi:MAG: hypothetical protein R3Y64_09655, partial [Peptostreptococcaceae bacterium]
EIDKLVEEGYKVAKTTTESTLTIEEGYEAEETTVTLTDGSDVRVYTFNTVDNLKPTITNKVEALREDFFARVIRLEDNTGVTFEDNTLVVDFAHSSAYKAANLLKHTLENA